MIEQKEDRDNQRLKSLKLKNPFSQLLFLFTIVILIYLISTRPYSYLCFLFIFQVKRFSWAWLLPRFRETRSCSNSVPENLTLLLLYYSFCCFLMIGYIWYFERRTMRIVLSIIKHIVINLDIKIIYLIPWNIL